MGMHVLPMSAMAVMGITGGNMGQGIKIRIIHNHSEESLIIFLNQFPPPPFMARIGLLHCVML